SPLADLPADAARLTDAARRLDGEARQLAALVTAVGDGLPVAEAPRASGPSAAEFRRVLAAEREAMLGQALSAMEAALDAEGLPAVDASAGPDGLRPYVDRFLGPRRDQWQALRAGARRVADGLDQIQRGLRSGCGLSETPAGASKSLADLWQEVRQQKVYARFEAVARPPADRIARLEAVGRTKEVARLLAFAAEAKPGGFEAARAAWLRLGAVADWPVTSEHLRTERQIRDRLAGAGASAEELTTVGRRRWQRWFLALEDAVAVAEAIRTVREFDLDGELVTPNLADLAELADPQARYKVLRHWLGEAAKAGRDEARLRAVRDRFVRLARARGGPVVDREPVKGLLAALANLDRPVEAGAGLAEAGPAAVGWTLSRHENGLAEYRKTTPNGRALALAFRRVEVPEAPPCYLGTTEVSLGLMVEAVEAARKWNDLMQLDPFQTMRGDRRIAHEQGYGSWDEWHGPRVWMLRFDRTGAGRIEPNVMWRDLPTGTFTDWTKAYPAGQAPGAPSSDHPVNYISPEVAIYVARLVGCRLPTPAEWQAACDGLEGSPAWNRRDRTWAALRDFVAGGRSARPRWPDGGIFVPEDLEDKVPRAARAQPAVEGSDGTVWFAPVGAGSPGPFHHLVGNVAEYVCAEAKAKAQESLPAPAGADRVLRFVEGCYRRDLMVIGGSALSPPEVEVGRPYPCG
ncbi:MAG: SUMF1/EgtB/PvdO family nonheme iron enzyme, partial [Planctomycetota bacterium]|nr:SUMF1/EgtB/PvdO family nonheme iron enzyme [Planctomycetota bacterium]